MTVVVSLPKNGFIGTIGLLPVARAEQIEVEDGSGGEVLCEVVLPDSQRRLAGGRKEGLQ